MDWWRVPRLSDAVWASFVLVWEWTSHPVAPKVGSPIKPILENRPSGSENCQPLHDSDPQKSLRVLPSSVEPARKLQSLMQDPTLRLATSFVSRMGAKETIRPAAWHGGSTRRPTDRGWRG